MTYKSSWFEELHFWLKCHTFETSFFGLAWYGSRSRNYDFFNLIFSCPFGQLWPTVKGSLNKPISIHSFFFCYWPKVHWGSKFWMTKLQALDNSHKTSLWSKWWEIMILQFQKEIRAAFLVLVLTNSKFCSHFNSTSYFYKLAWRNWQSITFST